MEDKIAAAECFLDGGTNFETPLREALRLMDSEGFEQADLVFITDGSCELSPEFSEEIRARQMANRFSVTGILLDAGSPGGEVSLQSFCREVYRTLELMGEKIVQAIVSDRL